MPERLTAGFTRREFSHADPRNVDIYTAATNSG
jgi:hypothetical protein